MIEVVDLWYLGLRLRRGSRGGEPREMKSYVRPHAQKQLKLRDLGIARSDGPTID
jgi:hypothetical protein